MRYTRFLSITAAVLLASVGLTVLYFSPPNSSWYLPQCTFYRLTGLLCPGCGATRSLYAFLHGDFAAAFRYNVLLWSLLPAIVILFCKPKLALNPRIAWIIPTVIILFFILRNIPCFPFTLLAPPQ